MTESQAVFFHALDELDSIVKVYQSLALLSKNASEDFSHACVVMRTLNEHMAMLAEVLRDISRHADWSDSHPAAYVGRSC